MILETTNGDNSEMQYYTYTYEVNLIDDFPHLLDQGLLKNMSENNDYEQGDIHQLNKESLLSKIEGEEKDILIKKNVPILCNGKGVKECVDKSKNSEKDLALSTLSDEDIEEITYFRIFTKPSTYFFTNYINERRKQVINNHRVMTNSAEEDLKIKNAFGMGKKLRKRKKRKYKPDDIRKKIKARFHKCLKNAINENLKNAGAQKLFDFLPQSFICNISKEKNKSVLHLTYKQLLEKDFIKDLDQKYSKRKVDEAKYRNNLEVLEYLEENPEISKKSGFDALSNLSYAEILNEYFNSKEFEKSILKLKEKKEDDEYIQEYYHKAKTYVKFFSN